MLWSGYFYWCGVVMNVIGAFWLVFGFVATVRNYIYESKIRKKYAVKNLAEDETEEDCGEGCGDEQKT